MKLARLGMCVAAAVVALASCGDDGEEPSASGTGGAGTGGAQATGGGVSTGGTAAGGGPSNGGTSSGGVTSSGGLSSGGASSGGAASGGAASGGASSGGAASGGTSSGGASSGGASSGGASPGAFALTSPVVENGGQIPARFRCQGPSPELSWSGGPAAQSYAIVFRDVTQGASNGFLHWIIYDLPPSTTSLPEGVPIGYTVPSPAGAHQGKIWNGTVGFNGPCGGNNTYEMMLYALDVATLTELSQSSSGAAARTAIEAHDVASTKLTILSRP